MRAWPVLLLISVAGCLQSSPEEVTPGPEVPAIVPVTLEDGRVAMDIPVPVVLIGFEPGVAAGLETALGRETVDHRVYNSMRSFVTDMGRSPPPNQPNWMLPTAVYSVYDMPQVHAELQARADTFIAEGGLNATAVEDWLAPRLLAAGVPYSNATPALVFIHIDKGPYRVVYGSGHIDDARVFGERKGMLIMDVSAPIDPWVGQGRPWEAPIGNGSDSIDVLAEATVHATHYRLLQGPLYPPALRPCHGVTLIVASRATAVTETAPGYQRAYDLLDVERLTTFWEALLGKGNVMIDPVGLDLPQDDPPLDQVLRTKDRNALRYYFDENWQDYWVPHDGCEEYVSLYLVGDATDSGISGIAMFDIRDGRRFSLSNFNDLDRARNDDDTNSPIFSQTSQSDDSIYTFDWVNFLFSHETGHLFGQRHPHDVTSSDAPGGARTWSSIWSAMSYQVGSKNAEFGTIDHNNHWRNKAAFAIVIADRQGHAETPEFAAAWEHMGRYEWVQAAEVLMPIVDPAGLAG